METIYIVIAGYGPVGQAVEAAFAEHPHVETYIDDPYKENLAAASPHESDDLFEVDGVVVCAATPMADDGSCDVSNITDIVTKYGKGTKYLFKSAVEPKHVEYLVRSDYDITVSPEFLRGSTGANPTLDFIEQTYAIYGGGSMRWWHELFKPVLPRLKDENVKFCSATQAAFAKYVENSFLACKVTFFNQMYEIYNALGFEDWDVMVDAITVDPRIGRSHTQVPGPDGNRGYGGHCLPKDISAIMELGKSRGADVSFLQDIVDFNSELRDDV